MWSYFHLLPSGSPCVKNKVWWHSKPDTAVIFRNIRQWFVTAQHDGHLIRSPFQNEYSIFLHISSSQLTVAYCIAWKFYLCTVSAARSALFLCWSQLRLPAGAMTLMSVWPNCREGTQSGSACIWLFCVCVSSVQYTTCSIFNPTRFCLKQVQIV